MRPCSTACWPRASSRNVFPVPEGPHTTRFSCRYTHSRVRSACWVGARIEDARGCHASKDFPVGNPAAARRVARSKRSLPATTSAKRALRTSAGSHRCPFAVGRDDLGSVTADVRQPQPAQQFFQVRGQRRRGADRASGRHGPPPIAGDGGGPLTERALTGPPSRVHESVPRAREESLLARCSPEPGRRGRTRTRWGRWCWGGASGSGSLLHPVRKAGSRP